MSPTGTNLKVVLVDCLEQLMASMRPASDKDGTVLVFDVDDPFALPAPEALVSAATNWASLAGTEGRAAFYSADSGTPVGTPKAAARQKKKSTPGATLLERQKTLEDQMATSQTRSILSRPLGGSLDLPQASLPAMTALLDPPPKTQLRRNPGLLETPKVNKPLEILELEAEKAPIKSGDALARAVYSQSQALTTLVGQIASARVDPLGDLSQSSGGMGSKGAMGRARLQSELAQHQGLFYKAVLQSMCRRMSPTSPVETSSQAMLDKGLSGTRYLERFGGYGKHRELGHIQFQVMTAMDHMMAGNIGGAQDTIALLAVMLEQMVLDGGRMEVAGLLCLQEDVPSSVFTNRQLSSTSRARSFAPLADQRWITVALQYLREMDLIASKRAEFAGGKASGSGANQEDDPLPKPKPKPKYRPRGRGRGGQTTGEEEA